MNLRNVLKAGEYAAVVPIGIPCAIEYDDRGILQHLYTSYDYRSDTVDDELKDLMYQKRKIPGKISITSGTSWVIGVIYTGRNFPGEGNLPDCILNEAVKYVKLENSSFNFFGAYVKSQAMRFSGPMNINQWLTMNKFNVLSNFIVPVKPNDKLIQSILSSHNCPFKYESICEYITISGEEVQHRPLGFYQIEVKSKSDFIDLDAFVRNVERMFWVIYDSKQDCFGCVNQPINSESVLGCGDSEKCNSCLINPNHINNYESRRFPKGKYTFSCKYDCPKNRYICCEECDEKDDCKDRCGSKSDECGLAMHKNRQSEKAD